MPISSVIIIINNKYIINIGWDNRKIDMWQSEAKPTTSLSGKETILSNQ